MWVRKEQFLRMEARIERHGKILDDLIAANHRARERRDFWLVKMVPAIAALAVIATFVVTVVTK